MGCSTVTQENEENKIEEKIAVRDEIVQLVTKNPFYNVHIKDFRKFMKQFKAVPSSEVSEPDEDEPQITKEYIMQNGDVVIFKIGQNKQK